MKAKSAGNRRGGRAVTVLLSVLAVLLAAAAILSWMALSDPNAGKGLEHIAPADTLAQTVLKSAAERKECSFSAGEVNGYLAYLLQKSGAGQAKGENRILAAAVLTMDDGAADLYLPVLYQGKRFGVVLNVTPSCDSAAGRLILNVNSIHIGRLPVPAGWALSFAKGRLPKGFSVDGSKIFCASPSEKASYAGVSGTLTLSGVKVESGRLTIAAKAALSLSVS